MPSGTATPSEISMAKTGELEAGPDPPANVVEHRLVAADRSSKIALAMRPTQVTYWT